jgi:predicted transcriptional regulator YdeE
MSGALAVTLPLRVAAKPFSIQPEAAADFRIVTKGEFWVLGVAGSGPYASAGEWVGQLWSTAKKRDRRLPQGLNKDCYVCPNQGRETEFTYYIGRESQAELKKLPPDTVAIRVPAHTYAVAGYQGPAGGRDVYADLTGWLERQGYETVPGALRIEVYPAGGSRPGDPLRLDVYLPVRTREPKASPSASPAAGSATTPPDREKQTLEPLRIKDTHAQNQKLEVIHSSFSHSLFENCRAEAVTFRDVSMPSLLFENANLQRVRFDDVNLSGGEIQNANLSDLQIKGAQLGGALFRHIGLPPADHPAHQAEAEQRPLRFEECDLHGSTVKDSDLSGVAISGCKMRGMSIDGIAIEDLLAAYREKQGERKAAAAPRGTGTSPIPNKQRAAPKGKAR